MMQPGSTHPLADAFDLRDPEMAIYTALKIEHYRRLTQAAGAAQPWITASRLVQMFSRGRPDRHAAQPAPDLFQASPYFFRERLRRLNHGTFLRGDGDTRRRALAYSWNEAVTPAQVHHFRELEAMLGRDVHLARDVQILEEAFGQGSFSVRDYLRCLHGRHRRVVGRGGGHRFHELLLERLARLRHRGLLVADGDDLRLGPQSARVLHVLDLFIFRAEAK